MNHPTINSSWLPLATLACLLLTGCSDPQREKLIGTWNLKTDNTALRRLSEPKVDQTGDTPPAETSSANPASSAGQMQLQFDRDGTLRTTTRMGLVSPTPKQGHWEITSFDSTKGIMNVTCTLGQQITEHDVEFVEPDTIRLTPPNLAGLGMKLQFTRQRR